MKNKNFLFFHCHPLRNISSVTKIWTKNPNFLLPLADFFVEKKKKKKMVFFFVFVLVMSLSLIIIVVACNNNKWKLNQRDQISKPTFLFWVHSTTVPLFPLFPLFHSVIHHSSHFLCLLSLLSHFFQSLSLSIFLWENNGNPSSFSL